MYSIRAVDTSDEDVIDTLEHLHGLSEFPPLKSEDYENGFWWIGCCDGKPVSYAGFVPSTHYQNAAYFKRVAVSVGHRGHGLQIRHMAAIERKAKSLGMSLIVSDTTGNIPSANNFIRAGYRMFQPEFPWAFPHSLYWRKAL